MHHTLCSWHRFSTCVGCLAERFVTPQEPRLRTQGNASVFQAASQTEEVFHTDACVNSRSCLFHWVYRSAFGATAHTGT